MKKDVVLNLRAFQYIVSGLFTTQITYDYGFKLIETEAAFPIFSRKMCSENFGKVNRKIPVV